MKPFRSLSFMVLGYLVGNLLLVLTYNFPAPLSGFYEKESFSRLLVIWDDLLFSSFFYIFMGGWLYFLSFILIMYIFQTKKINLPVLTCSFLWGALFSLIVLVLTTAEASN